MTLGMKTRGWKKNILTSVLQGHTKPQTVIPCDAIDNGCHELVFCIPDIERLARFIRIAKQKNDKQMFRIYCFEWQRKMIEEALDGDYVEVKIVSDDILSPTKKETES